MDVAILIALSAFSIIMWRRAKNAATAPPGPSAGAPAPPAASGGRATPAATAPAPPSVGAVVVPGLSTGLAPVGVGIIHLEPAGWLAAIIVHGGAVLGAIANYIKGGGSSRFLPFLYANWDADSWLDLHEGEGASTKFGGWHSYHCNLMPPSIVGCGPIFFGDPDYSWQHHCGGDGTDWNGVLDSVASNMASGDSYPYLWASGIQHETSTPYRNEPGVQKINPYDPESVPDVIFNLVMASDGTVKRPHISLSGVTLDPVCPAAGVLAWYQGTKFVNSSGEVDGSRWNWLRWAEPGTSGATAIDLATLNLHKQAPIVIPPYYRSTTALRSEFWKRLVRWYHRSAWLVWAAENYRVNCTHTATVLPSWWVKHCQAWGVGNVSLVDRAQHPPPSELVHDTSADYVWTLLHLVEHHTPVPGSDGTCGEQIVPRTMSAGKSVYNRALLDLPDNVGSIDPPYSCDSLAEYGINRWGAWAAAKSAASSAWVSSIISLEVGLCSAGFASAVVTPIAAGMVAAGAGAASNLVCKVINIALQNAFRMGTGGPGPTATWGDVVGLAGEAVDAMGLSSTIKTLPDSVWGAVKQAGHDIPLIAGADNDTIQVVLGAMQSSLENIRNAGWPYIDAAYGGLGLSETAKNKGQEHGPSGTNLF